MLILDSKEARTNPVLKRYLLTVLKDEVEVDDLLSGDCAAVDTPLTLGVEHKSFPDFVGSLSSRRLDEQMARLVATYDVPVLVVDEIPPERGGKLHLFGAKRSVNFNWVFGSIMGWALRGVIPLLVRTPASVGPAVVSCYRMAQKEEHREQYEPKRILDNLRPMGVTERVLLQLPGIGPDRVAKLAHLTPAQLGGMEATDWKKVLGPVTGERAYTAWHTGGSNGKA